MDSHNKMMNVRSGNMLKGLSTAGLGDVSSLSELVTLASENGFDAVETTSEQLKTFITEFGVQEAKRFLEEKDILLGAISLPVEWRKDDAAFNKGIYELIECAEIASELGCKTFFTYFMPSTDYELIPYFMTLSKRLRLLGRLLAQYGMELALEYVGPHHLRNKWQHPFIWNAKDTLNWVDFIGEKNIGIVLDSFHWYTSEETVDTILSLDVHHVKYAHINDARNVSVHEVLDNDRVYPGEGIIDLKSFLEAINKINYRGIITQEVLTIEKPTDSNEALAEKSARAFQNVFHQAGLI